MIHVVWEFLVRPSALDAFQRAYRPNGVWYRLFQSYPGYRGTILLRDRRHPRRFITVDVWARESDRERMLTDAKPQYVAIDRRLTALTEHEHEIGIFSSRARLPSSWGGGKTRGQTKRRLC